MRADYTNTAMRPEIFLLMEKVNISRSFLVVSEIDLHVRDSMFLASA